MPKTDLEIQSEWKALRAMKKSVPRLNRYRVNQWAMIDAQIETLSGGFSLSKIKKHWNADEEGDCRGAAEDALYWKQGGDVPSPVESWRGLVVSESAKKEPIKQGVS